MQVAVVAHVAPCHFGRKTYVAVIQHHRAAHQRVVADNRLCPDVRRTCNCRAGEDSHSFSDIHVPDQRSSRGDARALRNHLPLDVREEIFHHVQHVPRVFQRLPHACIRHHAVHPLLHQRVHRPLVMVVAGNILLVLLVNRFQQFVGVAVNVRDDVDKVAWSVLRARFFDNPRNSPRAVHDQVAAGEVILALVSRDICRRWVGLVGVEQRSVQGVIHDVVDLYHVDRRPHPRGQQRRGLQQCVSHAFRLGLHHHPNRHRADLPRQRPHILGVRRAGNDHRFFDAKRLKAPQLADQERLGSKAQEQFFA